MTHHYHGLVTPGTPHKYETPAELEEKIEAYFLDCQEQGKRPTRTGLVLASGFSSYTRFADQAKRPGFEELVATAIMRVVEVYEDNLLTGKGTTGAIFALTNIKTEPEGAPAAWVSKQQTELTGKDGAELLKGIAPADLPFFIDQLKAMAEGAE